MHICTKMDLFVLNAKLIQLMFFTISIWCHRHSEPSLNRFVDCDTLSNKMFEFQAFQTILLSLIPIYQRKHEAKLDLFAILDPVFVSGEWPIDIWGIMQAIGQSPWTIDLQNLITKYGFAFCTLIPFLKVHSIAWIKSWYIWLCISYWEGKERNYSSLAYRKFKRISARPCQSTNPCLMFIIILKHCKTFKSTCQRCIYSIECIMAKGELLFKRNKFKKFDN